MASLTRFYDRVDDKDGPVSGALQVIGAHFSAVGNSATGHRRIQLPAGAGFLVTDISLTSGTVASDPVATIGTTVGGTQIMAGVTLTAASGTATVKDGEVSAGGFIDIRVVSDIDDSAVNVSVTLIGHLTSPPTSVPVR